MGPREAVTVCLQDYAEFRGRARRPEFWWWMGITTGSVAVLDVLDGLLWGPDRLLGFGGLAFLLVAVPTVTVHWRRLQDTGIPGWIVLVPIALGFLRDRLFFSEAPMKVVWTVSALDTVATVLVYAGCLLPSQPGPNIYGSEPPARRIRWDF